MLEEFAASRRAEATRKGYPKMMRLLVPDPDAFLLKAKADRRAAEDELIRAIVRRRNDFGTNGGGDGRSLLSVFWGVIEITAQTLTGPGSSIRGYSAQAAGSIRSTYGIELRLSYTAPALLFLHPQPPLYHFGGV